jgi:hypothetical protein
MAWTKVAEHEDVGIPEDTRAVTASVQHESHQLAKIQVLNDTVETFLKGLIVARHEISYGPYWMGIWDARKTLNVRFAVREGWTYRLKSERQRAAGSKPAVPACTAQEDHRNTGHNEHHACRYNIIFQCRLHHFHRGMHWQ